MRVFSGQWCLAAPCSTSCDAVMGFLYMFVLAFGAAPWFCKTSPVFENIPAGHTSGRNNNELLPVGYHGTRDVAKMSIDLFFWDTQQLRKIPGPVRLPGQQHNHLLSYCRHGAMWQSLCGIRPKKRFAIASLTKEPKKILA